MRCYATGIIHTIHCNYRAILHSEEVMSNEYLTRSVEPTATDDKMEGLDICFRIVAVITYQHQQYAACIFFIIV